MDDPEDEDASASDNDDKESAQYDNTDFDG
jgi:hypothetical protein